MAFSHRGSHLMSHSEPAVALGWKLSSPKFLAATVGRRSQLVQSLSTARTGLSHRICPYPHPSLYSTPCGLSNLTQAGLVCPVNTASGVDLHAFCFTIVGRGNIPQSDTMSIFIIQSGKSLFKCTSSPTILLTFLTGTSIRTFLTGFGFTVLVVRESVPQPDVTSISIKYPDKGDTTSSHKACLNIPTFIILSTLVYFYVLSIT